jgi:peptidyl-prolyl cis-trans isomerase C
MMSEFSSMSNPRQVVSSMTPSGIRQVGKFLGRVALAGLLAGAINGQTPQNPPAKPPSTPILGSASDLDKVVMKVGDENVTQADLDFIIATMNPQAKRVLTTQGRRALGDQYATLLVLEQRALAEHLDSSPAFARQLAMKRRELLAEAAYTEIARQAAVTPEEASQYYAAHPDEFEQLKVRQVIIRKRAEGAPPGAKGLPAAEARSRAEDVRKAMIAGADPKKVVEQFQVPEVVIIDADPRDVRRDALPADMQKAAAQLKDGEVSEVFDLPQVVALFQLVARRQPELKEVSAQIENSLRQKKIEAALADLKKGAHIWTDDAYFAPPQPTPPEGTSKTPPTSPPAKP